MDTVTSNDLYFHTLDRKWYTRNLQLQALNWRDTILCSRLELPETKTRQRKNCVYTRLITSAPRNWTLNSWSPTQLSIDQWIHILPIATANSFVSDIDDNTRELALLIKSKREWREFIQHLANGRWKRVWMGLTEPWKLVKNFFIILTVSWEFEMTYLEPRYNEGQRDW